MLSVPKIMPSLMLRPVSYTHIPLSRSRQVSFSINIIFPITGRCHILIKTKRSIPNWTSCPTISPLKRPKPLIEDTCHSQSTGHATNSSRGVVHYQIDIFYIFRKFRIFSDFFRTFWIFVRIFFGFLDFSRFFVCTRIL